MRLVEIDGGDALRIGNKIREDIAAAGRDRDDMALRREGKRFKIDFRIFPDLRIDQTLEHPGKQMLKKSLARQRGAATDGRLQAVPAFCQLSGMQLTLLRHESVGDGLASFRCQFDDSGHSHKG